jgi:hypothetical protein
MKMYFSSNNYEFFEFFLLDGIFGVRYTQKWLVAAKWKTEKVNKLYYNLEKKAFLIPVLQ